MSEEQTPQTSEAECSAMEFTEFEDEERWFFEGKDLLFFFYHCLKEENDPSGPEFRDTVSFQFPLSRGETIFYLSRFSCFSCRLPPDF